MDTRAFLTARLVDVFLGDWDRHQDQWRWARLGDSDRVPWTRSREIAIRPSRGSTASFSASRACRRRSWSPSPDVPEHGGAHLECPGARPPPLTGLEWSVWDSVSTDLKSRLTDGVIDDAVAHLPPEFQARGAAPARGALKSRRRPPDRGRPPVLPPARRRGGRVRERQGRAGRGGPGRRRTLDLTIYPAKDASAEPLFHRSFLARETKEVRLTSTAATTWSR